MGTKLSRVASPAHRLPVKRSDARQDTFVREHMSKGQELVCASKYTQSTASCVAQIALIGLPAGILAGTLAGPLVAALMFGGFATMVVGFEVTNRVAVTKGDLVLQTSVLLRRFERERMHSLRVETLSFRHWARLDVHLLDPTYFFRKAPGLRFEYAKPNGKVVQVFVGLEDAEDLLNQLTR